MLMKRQRPDYRPAVAAAVLFLAVCILSVPAEGNTSKIELTAHRGDSAHCPENTIAAFQAAADLGVDCIELDLQTTSDGVFVVLHDQNLRRTIGVDLDIKKMSYAELEKLDAGHWYSTRFAGQQVPTFEQVLDLAKKDHVRLNAEIKPEDLDSDGIKTLIDLIERHHMESQCAVASWNYEILRRVKRCRPAITTVYVVGTRKEDVEQLRCADEISMKLDCVTPDVVKRVHACGKRLHVWTADTPAEVRTMTDLQVDDIITDDPAMAMIVWTAG